MPLFRGHVLVLMLPTKYWVSTLVQIKSGESSHEIYDKEELVEERIMHELRTRMESLNVDEELEVSIGDPILVNGIARRKSMKDYQHMFKAMTMK